MSNQVGNIDLTDLLTKQISSLYMSEYCSDITLYVRGHKIPAHRSIIGARCDYLYFSNMLNNPNQNEFKLNYSFKPFHVVLEYIYTGQMILSKFKNLDILFEILSLVEEFCLIQLKPHFENYFNQILSVENACRLLMEARKYKLKELEIKCLNLIDSNPDQILTSDSFKIISKQLLEEILTRDFFSASSELCIFNAINEWSKYENRNIETVIHLVDLPLIPLEELLRIRNLGLLTGEKIFDAIEKQMAKENFERPGLQKNPAKPNENVATSRFNARTIQGYMSSRLLDANETNPTEHPITDSNNSGIIVELGRIFSINNLKMLLWDNDDHRSYSYFIEISTDQKKWERIIDYSLYSCRSWQNLYFPVKPIKYIKIVGTNCSANNNFSVVTLEVYNRKIIPEIRIGFVVPTENVALVNMGATIVGALNGNFSINNIINGNPSSGYTLNRIKSGDSISIRLSQPYHIGSLRLLLEDFNNGYKYKFYIKTSLNNRDWEEIVNKRNEFVTSWQIFRFSTRPVLFIKIVWMECNSRFFSVFSIKHFECPSEA